MQHSAFLDMRQVPLTKSGIVIKISGRQAHILTDSDQILSSFLTAKVASAVPGDFVTIEVHKREQMVSAIRPRRNSLFRSYRDKKRVLAANLDHLFLVSAVTPSFNTYFVDRVLVLCALQNIPVTLIVNKIDLDPSPVLPFIKLYEDLGLPTLLTSIKKSEGLISLQEMLCDPALSITALAGISGVGKSSMLNMLIPGLALKTGVLSTKIQQGRHTTSQAIAHPFPRPPLSNLLIIDLPGVQAFGVAGLQERDVARAFPEFVPLASHCQFTDCLHVAEPNCAVKSALAQGRIVPSRYESYLGMIKEIRSARPY